jgi:hypothetical protein
MQITLAPDHVLTAGGRFSNSAGWGQGAIVRTETTPVRISRTRIEGGLMLPKPVATHDREPRTSSSASFCEDIELFRDDLAKILLEETEKHVEYCFGDETSTR